MVDKAHSKSDGFTLIEILIVVGIIGIISAIAIPNMQRARLSANEAQMIGDTRSVISSSASYASANCGGYAPSLNCLSRGDGTPICIPNYAIGAPDFIGHDISRATPYVKAGYKRDYMGVGAAMGNIDPTICDVNSVFDFCYTGVPSQPGSTGVRSFNGTSSGAVFEDLAGDLIACPVPPGTDRLGN